MFFSNWENLARVVIVGFGAYISLIVVLRISGKRTLSKMNAFDLIVTVALGSILATSLLSKDVALAEAVVAFVTLITLQFIIAWLSVRSDQVRRMVKAEPTLLFHRGDYLVGALKVERVTQEEVRAAVRAQGIVSMDDVGAVVLETDGSFTVLPTISQNASALIGVRNAPSEIEQFS